MPLSPERALRTYTKEVIIYLVQRMLSIFAHIVILSYKHQKYRSLMTLLSSCAQADPNALDAQSLTLTVKILKQPSS
jgi:hypothetical protein